MTREEFVEYLNDSSRRKQASEQCVNGAILNAFDDGFVQADLEGNTVYIDLTPSGRAHLKPTESER